MGIRIVHRMGIQKGWKRMKATKKEIIRIWEVIKLRNLDESGFKHINCVRIHPTESKEHFLKKCEIAWEIHSEGKPFLTEALTKNKKRRYDVLDLIDNIAYEVETGKSNKKNDDSKEINI